MKQVPDALRVERYGAPDPASPAPVTTVAWRTTGYALVIQVGLWVVVTLVAAFVGGFAAVGVTALVGFSMAWLLESAVRRFGAPAHHDKVAVAVFAVAGAVVGGALVALAVRGELERPGDIDPITAGVLVWGVVAGALPAGAGRWLAARRERERRQTAV